MKKTLSVLLCVCMILSLFTVISYAKVYERPEYDTSEISVTIKKDYSGQGGIYYPFEFSWELVESAGKNFFIYLDPLYIMGDADNNGLITARDARILLRISVGLEKREARHICQFDTDNDKKTTAADARKVLRVSIGLEEPQYYEYSGG